MWIQNYEEETGKNVPIGKYEEEGEEIPKDAIPYNPASHCIGCKGATKTEIMSKSKSNRTSMLQFCNVDGYLSSEKGEDNMNQTRPEEYL